MAAPAAAAVTTAAGGSDSSFSSESPVPNWVMVDRYVFTSHDLSSWKEDETTSPQCRTSQDDPFRVSFRFVAPPAISRFYLHVGGGNLSEDCQNRCRIIASHRSAVLFCLYVPLPVPVEYLSNREDEPYPRFFKQDLFVYTAGHRPSLKLLPPCLQGDEDEEAIMTTEGLYNPLAGIIQFSSDVEGLGVLCNDDGDYVVAYLCVSREISSGSRAEVVEAQLCLYFSSDSHWELHGLPIDCVAKDFDALCSWSTKRVVAFGTYLCWIDYHCGILFCEVFREPLVVTYISLPVDAHRFPKVCMDLYRSISVVDDEGRSKMKFVDVRPSHGYANHPLSNEYKISFWTLIMEDGNMSWILEHEFVIRDNELRISNCDQSPHGPLTFPIVSMQEPDISYFVVSELGYCVKKVWLVSVNMTSGSVKDVFPYLNGEDDLFGDDAEMAIRKLQCCEPFLPSEISKFFQKITRDTTAVRKGPATFPRCLQGDLPVGNSETSVKKEDPMLPWASSNVPEPNVGWVQLEPSMDCAQNKIPRIVFPQGVTGDLRLRQISFRLLCPVNLAGGLIGKKGLIIKGIENETGVCIDIGAYLNGCMERVITIAAIESPEQCSKVQEALLRIFERMVEVERNAGSMFDRPSQSSARALVLKSQVDCLVGLGGATIKEMVNITRARIQILDDTAVPACTSCCERVLQITGDLSNVSYALFLVSSKLRDHVFSSKRTNHSSGYDPPSDFAERNSTRHANISLSGRYLTDSFHRVDHGSSLSYEIDPVESSFSAINLSTSEFQKPYYENGVGIKNLCDGMRKPAYLDGIGINSSNSQILV